MVVALAVRPQSVHRAWEAVELRASMAQATMARVVLLALPRATTRLAMLVATVPNIPRLARVVVVVVVVAVRRARLRSQRAMAGSMVQVVVAARIVVAATQPLLALEEMD